MMRVSWERCLGGGVAAIAIGLLHACGDHGTTVPADGAGTAGSPIDHSGHGTGGAGGHSDLPAAPEMLPVSLWDGDLSLPELADQDSAPGIVEVTLRAAPAEIDYLGGTPTTVWAYEGRVPGPLLRAQVGDRIVVHFTNDLPEPTTIHWHGMRVPAAMDGTAAVQDPVAPGGSFDYEFVALDAGTFWYHPHVRSDAQLEQGLYGAIVIEDPGEPLAELAAEVVVLSDVQLDPVTKALDDTLDARVSMMGREGNLVLVNGRPSNLRVASGSDRAHRLRVVNAASARFFDLMVHGGSMVRIGGDRGLLEAPEPVSHLLLANGERADLVVIAGESAATTTLVAMPYERAIGAGTTDLVELVHWSSENSGATDAWEIPDVLRPSDDAAADVGADRSLVLDEIAMGPHFAFRINGAVFPDVPLIETQLGVTETWEIVNDSEMDHPFHLHGFFFRSIGQREWKDTIQVPAKATVRISPSFDAREGAAGTWMYHCHILGHAEGGMMGEVTLR